MKNTNTIINRQEVAWQIARKCTREQQLAFINEAAKQLDDEALRYLISSDELGVYANTQEKIKEMLTNIGANPSDFKSN